MPRYYCDYCDTYLTHDSPSVRKQHNAGYKHKANVRTYYQQFEEQQTQSLIDQKIKEHLSGQTAYGQVGAAYMAWRPPGVGVRPPILPAPLPIPGSVPQMTPGVRLPILPRPAGVPVYGTAPGTAPVPGQPGVPTAPLQANGPPGPPAFPGSTSAAGAAPASNGGAPPTAPHSQPMYQGIPGGGNFGGASMPPASTFPSSGGSGAYPTTSSSDTFSYSQAPNGSR